MSITTEGFECSMHFDFANTHPIQNWQKFKTEKLALLQQLHDKRAEFAQALVKKYLKAQGKLSEYKLPLLLSNGVINSTSSKTNLQTENNPTIIFSLAPNQEARVGQTETISKDKAKHIVEFFSLLEEQNTREANPALIEVRNKVAAEFSPKTLQLAASLLLEASLMPKRNVP